MTTQKKKIKGRRRRATITEVIAKFSPTRTNKKSTNLSDLKNKRKRK
jgi:hypothetical protein